MTRASLRRLQRGFSLVEVMVAVVVICVGLLGIAKMQALSLSNTTTARLRSLASFEAAGLAAAMHANRQYWANSPAATINITGGAAVTVATTVDVYGLQAATTADLATAPNIAQCIGTTGNTPKCGANNGADMAAFDLANWAYSLNGLLPNAVAFISCSSPTPPTSCTIQISWTEQAVANNNAQNNVSGAGAENINNPTYTLYVQP